MTFEQRLRKKIEEERNTQQSSLLSGHLNDFAEYRSRCRYLSALDNVEAWMDEISKQLNSGE